MTRNGWRAGNGDYGGELHWVLEALRTYLSAQHILLAQALVRLDCQYGKGAVTEDLAGPGYVMRGKDYHLLDRAEVQSRL